ncbi:MAG: hypothetical protein K9J83_03280 [Desulfarculaceae bacterium]|nr:hypothetical protein [Desulfarculaceae bacterium]
MKNKNNDGDLGEMLNEIEILVDRYRFKEVQEKLVRVRRTLGTPSGH